MRKTQFTVALLALLLALPALAGSINKSVSIEAGGASDGASSVNGSISVGDNARVSGDVSTVNGTVRIGTGAVVEEASTVNGSMKVSDNVRSASLSTVNGAMMVGAASTVDGSVETVNGRITVATGTSISGDVGNVNGQIELRGATVGGNVSTVTGDVSVIDGSVVDGDLIVEKPGGWTLKKRRKPKIVIGPGSTVKGDIVLEWEVELFISETAKVGGVSGVMTMDDAVRFSGDSP